MAGDLRDQPTDFPENKVSTKFSLIPRISPWEKGQRVNTSMRPARDSESFGRSITFADPVSRNRPGWRFRSMAALITEKSSGTCWISSRIYPQNQARKASENQTKILDACGIAGESGDRNERQESPDTLRVGWLRQLRQRGACVCVLAGCGFVRRHMHPLVSLMVMVAPIQPNRCLKRKNAESVGGQSSSLRRSPYGLGSVLTTFVTTSHDAIVRAW
jgi:hypothetical protein